MATENPTFCIRNHFIIMLIGTAGFIIIQWLHPPLDLQLMPTSQSQKFRMDKDLVKTQTEWNIKFSVAIGLGLKYKQKISIKKMPFFTLLLDSFCRTTSEGYTYYFMIACDSSDEMFQSNTTRENFENYFLKMLAVNCTASVRNNTSLHWTVTYNKGLPARAQNDAMVAAYHHCNCDYYFRCVDDAIFETEGWTERLISGLQNMDPPNVGFVGPKIKNSPKNLITMEFVHRTHFENFGHYYPYLFQSCWADSWLNHVYSPTHKKVIEQVRYQIIHCKRAHK